MSQIDRDFCTWWRVSVHSRRCAFVNDKSYHSVDGKVEIHTMTIRNIWLDKTEKKKFQNRSRKCVSKFSNDTQTPWDLNPNHGYMVSEWKVLIKQDTKKPDHPILWSTQGALWHLKVCKLRESYTNSRKNKKMWFTNIQDQVIGIKPWITLSNNATRLDLISHSVFPRVPRVVSSAKATRKSSLEEVLEHDWASGWHSLQHGK